MIKPEKPEKWRLASEGSEALGGVGVLPPSFLLAILGNSNNFNSNGIRADDELPCEFKTFSIYPVQELNDHGKTTGYVPGYFKIHNNIINNFFQQNFFKEPNAKMRNKQFLLNFIKFLF